MTLSGPGSVRWGAAAWLATALCLGGSFTHAQAPITGAPGTITRAPAGCIMHLDPEHLVRRTEGGSAFDAYVADPWPGGIVPIEFDPLVSDGQKTLFYTACRAWAAGTGVQCVPRSAEAVFVQVTPQGEDECSSHIGRRRNNQPTVVTLSDGCWTVGTVQHEIGHAIGLIHEHQRADRDEYVVVDLTQVEAEKERFFNRIASSRDHTPYDFGSVMHYGESDFGITPSSRVLSVRPGLPNVRLGGARVSTTDQRFTTALYGLGYATPGSGRPGPAVPFRITTHEALSVMQGLDRFYRAPDGLMRANGLSLGGRPDFLGLAAWFFDVYMATRYAGYEEADARYNVAATITQSDEWRGKHPGWATATPLPVTTRLPFSRDELLAVMERLDRFYAAPEGLQRPNGLSINGGPDLLGIANWVVDVFLGARVEGRSAESAWASVEQAIRNSDEWRAKH